MPMTNAEKQRAWYYREKKKKDNYMEERRQLFVDFAAAFPGAIRVGVEPVLDEPDLKDPIRVSLVFPTDLKHRIAGFALDRGMEPDRLVDLLTEEAVERMRSRKLVPDVDRTLIE